jgi:hypothetical protein
VPDLQALHALATPVQGALLELSLPHEL